MNKRSISQDTAIKLIGTTITIFGLTLTPLVSSSKNLNRPAPDAGKGHSSSFLPFNLAQGN